MSKEQWLDELYSDPQYTEDMRQQDELAMLQELWEQEKCKRSTIE